METIIIVTAMLGMIIALAVFLRAEVTKVEESITSFRQEIRAELHTEIAGVRTEIGELRAELHNEIAGVRTEIGDLRAELHSEIIDLRTDLRGEIGELRMDVRVLEERIFYLGTGQPQPSLRSKNLKMDPVPTPA